MRRVINCWFLFVMCLSLAKSYRKILIKPEFTTCLHKNKIRYNDDESCFQTLIVHLPTKLSHEHKLRRQHFLIRKTSNSTKRPFKIIS